MSGANLRVAFAGTPDFAARALDAIISAGFEVVLVLTQPDRPSGRGMKQLASPVKQLALAHGIAVDQPEKLRTDAQRATLAACAPDVLVVAAYGLILPREVLALPRLGCINIHASLLPRWRGAAPIHRAIEAGDSETGITIMRMDEGLDTGPMLMMQAMAINAADTTATLHDRLATLGAQMIVGTLRQLPLESLAASAQPLEGVTYAAKIAKHEAVVDWRRPAVELERAIRAFNPFPVATATLRDSPVKIWRAELATGEGRPGEILSADSYGLKVACGSGALRLVELQKPGSRRMPVAEFLRGFPVNVGGSFDLEACPEGSRSA